MNWPNRLSLIRVACVPLVTALIIMDGLTWTAPAALIVFVLASATDWLDGWMARKYKLITNFGKFIDPVADKLLVVSTMTALCGRGLLPAWAVVIVLFRELAVDGLRLVAVEQGHVIAAGKLGKIKTTTQMLTLICYLLRACGALADSFLPGTLLTLALVMTVWSGVDYFIRNKEVLHG